MWIEFTISGENNEVGRFTAGEQRDVPENVAELFKLRRMAVDIANNEPAEVIDEPQHEED